jgi:hypothetical protein
VHGFVYEIPEYVKKVEQIRFDLNDNGPIPEAKKWFVSYLFLEAKTKLYINEGIQKSINVTRAAVTINTPLMI